MRDMLFHQRKKDVFIKAGKKALDINLQIEFWFLGGNYFAQMINGQMRAFIFAAGIGMENEFRCKNRFQIINQQMMDNPVAVISRPNFTQFGIGNGEAGVLLWPVSAGIQSLLQI